MNGTAILNEAMLTGESVGSAPPSTRGERRLPLQVPVTKVALPEMDADVEFSFKDHSKHIMFSGTTVLQTRYYSGKPVQALVLRTGYATRRSRVGAEAALIDDRSPRVLAVKGTLVRSIMFPQPVDFRFTKDLLKFVGFLAGIACVGFVYTITIMILRGSVFKKIFIRSRRSARRQMSSR